MPLQINWEDKVIEITSPTVSVDGQTLHNFIEDNMATARGNIDDDIIMPEGKIEDPSQPGIYSQIIIVLYSPWQIQFWQGSGYTKISGAKIVGGLNDEVIKATGAAGDVTVLISPVDGTVVVSGSGITAQDKSDIINGVWDEVRLGAFTMEDMMTTVQRMVLNKVTKSGDIITIYEEDGNTPWKTFNLASEGRVEM